MLNDEPNPRLSPLEILYRSAHHELPNPYEDRLRTNPQGWHYTGPYRGMLNQEYPHALYREGDSDYWTLQNQVHPNAITRRAVAPLINLAAFPGNGFQNILVRHPSMLHIIENHGRPEIRVESGFPMSFGSQQLRRADNPSTFNTRNPDEIAALGRDTVLNGIPFLEAPGNRIGLDWSSLNFVNEFPNPIGTRYSQPTSTALFSFAVGPDYSHLWSVPQAAQAFRGENPQIRLQSGYPVAPLAAPTVAASSTSIGRAAASLGHKRGGFMRSPSRRLNLGIPNWLGAPVRNNRPRLRAGNWMNALLQQYRSKPLSAIPVRSRLR